MTEINLFGNIDAADVPDDPFYVAPGTYFCILTEVAIRETNAGGHGLSIKWVITDEDSDFNNSSVGDWFNLYPGVAEDALTPNQKRARSNLKTRMLNLGVSEQEMNTIHNNLDDLVGITAMVTVKETKDKNDPDKKYTNVAKVVRTED